MFASLKLNSLKCQSSGEDGKKNEHSDEDVDNVSDHTYEKLPAVGLGDNKPCKCSANHTSRSPKQQKAQLAKRISKFRTFQGTGFRTKVTTVSIEREDGNLGITLRGGFHQNSELSKPLIITHTKPDGPAAREGSIKAGDRLLAVDGISLQGNSLSEAQAVLKKQSASTLLTIEYDVNVLDSVEHASGPLLVEIEHPPGQELGLTLYQNQDGIVVEKVKTGSLADRCGALHVGDEILAVNNMRVDGAPLSLEDVVQLLECDEPVLRLEILPSYAVELYSNFGTWRDRANILSPTSSMSGVSTLRYNPGKRSREGIAATQHDCNGMNAKCIEPSSFYGSNVALTHFETLHTTISKENDSFGIEFTDSHNGSLVIASLTPGGPAERCQCLHPGDRVLSVNHRSVALNNLTAKDINEILDAKSTDISSKLSLHTEFDVLDTVVPTSGIFTVKLAKRGSKSLGITITASKSTGFQVCEMKKGSIAHRAGSLMPGDKLLAINDVPLDQCSIEYAAHILHQSTNIVALKIQRNEAQPDIRNNRKVIYTVELQRYGGPLGITIAGSEEPFQPITVSGLTPGGLAEQTGVLHLGDEILAINNHVLYGEPLSRAHSLLQSSAGVVILKVSRSIIQPSFMIPNSRSPILPSSIDSAVESWDSSHLDLTPSPDQKTTQESRDFHNKRLALTQWQTSNAGYVQYAAAPEMNHISNGISNSTNDNPNLALLDEITSENLKIKQELDLLSTKLEEQCKSKESEKHQSPEALNCEKYSLNGCCSNETKSISVNPEQSEENGAEEQCDSNLTDNYVKMKPLELPMSPTGDEGGLLLSNRESCMTADFENFEMNAFLPDTRDWYRTQYLGNENSEGSIRSEFHSSQLYKVTLYKDPIYEDFGFSVSDGLYERGVFINRIRKGGPADLSNALKPFDRILQVNDTFTQDFDCCLTVPLIASAGDSLVLLVARNTSFLSSNHAIFEQDRVQSSMILSQTGADDTHNEPTQRILV